MPGNTRFIKTPSHLQGPPEACFICFCFVDRDDGHILEFGWFSVPSRCLHAQHHTPAAATAAEYNAAMKIRVIFSPLVNCASD